MIHIAQFSLLYGIYFVIKNGVLIGYKGNDDDVVIPDIVSRIGAGVFEHTKNIRSITIPDSVTIITSSAFCRCYNLTKVIPPTA